MADNDVSQLPQHLGGSEQPIGVRQLRASLARFVRRAAAGENLIITVGGEAAARLGPVEGAQHPPSLEALAHVGLIEPPRRPKMAQSANPADRRSSAAPLPVDVRVDRLVRQVRG